MDDKMFDEWVKAIRLDPKLTPVFYAVLSQHPQASMVLKVAAKRRLEAKNMLSLLKSQGLNTELIEEAMSQPVPPEGFLPIPGSVGAYVPSPTKIRKANRPPVSPRGAPYNVAAPEAEPETEATDAPEASPQKQSFWNKFLSYFVAKDQASAAPQKGSKKTWWIVGCVVAVLLLAGYFVYSAMSTPSYDLSYGTTDFTTMATPTVVPGGVLSPETSPATVFVAPTQTPEPDRWQQFMELNRVTSETSGPFLDKPESWKDIFNKFPTKWLLWIAFLFPMWTLLKQDRLASEELTDVKAANRGLIVLFVCVLGAGILSAATTYVAINIIGASTEIPRYFFISIGIVVNLFVQWTAAMNGRKDYSTFSVGGLFFTGVLLVWWFTPNLPMVVLGSLFMGAGIWLQNIEMRRTHQGWAAHVTALVMLGMFAGVTAIFYFALGFIPPITSAMPWIQQFLFAVLYSGRLFIGATIGFLAAFAGGDYVSTLIMPPSEAGGVSLAGSKSDDDMSHKYDVNARFDAMNYAIMLLYPLATAVWYLAAYL